MELKNELTIKHLGRRIAYGVKVEHTVNSWGVLNKKIAEIEMIGAECITFSGNCCDYMFDYPENDCEFKPILHPLPDLTKPITHKGETFIPIEKLNTMYGMEEVYLTHYQNSGIGWVVTSSMANTAITFKEMYLPIEKLLEWHFVIDEPEGTWIDVNTLETNPYK